MTDSSSSESSLISESDYLDFEASMEGENNERSIELLGKSGSDDFNRQKHYEPKIERKSQKRIKNPCPAAASIKIATNSECIMLINKVSENQLLIKYKSAQVRKIKCADSWIPRERSVFVLHAWTFRSLGFTDREDLSIYTRRGTLDRLTFESSFSHYIRFNAFVSVLGFLLLNLEKD